MKKATKKLALACLALVSCAAIGVSTGCESVGETFGALGTHISNLITSITGKHTHDFTTLKSGANGHWYECECGEADGNVQEHDFATVQYDADYHWSVCECGAESAKEAHTGGEATETEQAICEVCQQPYGELVVNPIVEFELFIDDVAANLTIPAGKYAQSSVYVRNPMGADVVFTFSESVTVTVNETAVTSGEKVTLLGGAAATVVVTPKDSATETVATIEAATYVAPVVQLAIGENAIDVTDAEVGTNVEFTATEAGEYVLKVAEGEENSYVSLVIDGGVEAIDLPYTFTLEAGATIGFNVSTYDMAADTVDLVLAKPDYTVAAKSFSLVEENGVPYGVIGGTYGYSHTVETAKAAISELYFDIEQFTTWFRYDLTNKVSLTVADGAFAVKIDLSGLNSQTGYFMHLGEGKNWYPAEWTENQSIDLGGVTYSLEVGKENWSKTLMSIWVKPNYEIAATAVSATLANINGEAYFVINGTWDKEACTVEEATQILQHTPGDLQQYENGWPRIFPATIAEAKEDGTFTYAISLETATYSAVEGSELSHVWYAHFLTSKTDVKLPGEATLVVDEKMYSLKQGYPGVSWMSALSCVTISRYSDMYLGENEIIITQTEADGMGAYYTFTAEKTGTYVFSSADETMVAMSEGFPKHPKTGMITNLEPGFDWPEVVVELTAGQTIELNIVSIEYAAATYTLTIHLHVPAEAVKENEVAATCAKEGSYESVVYCSECNEELSRTTETVAKLAHTPAEAVKENEVEADCTTEGSYDLVVRCTVCNEVVSSETVKIDKTKHPYELNKTETKHWEECLDCGDVTNEAAHFGGNANFVAKAVCEFCSAEYGELVEVTPANIVKEAYELAVGEKLQNVDSETFTLTGVITAIGTFNTQFNNVTATIVVEGLTEYPIECYRLKGTGADIIAIGDIITVIGVLTNYNGKIEFNAGCTLDSYVLTDAHKVVVDADAITLSVYELTTVDAYVELPAVGANGSAITWALKETSDYVTIADGKLTAKDIPAEPVEIVVIATLTAGAETTTKEITIKVGVHTHTEAEAVKENEVAATCAKEGSYESVVYCAGCKEELSRDTIAVETIAHTYALSEDKTKNVCSVCNAEKSFADIVTELYALASGSSLKGTYYLQGKILSVPTAYDASYKNVTVVIEVAGMEGYPVTCYRMKGDGADEIAAYDTIIVSGTLKNFNGTYEFDSGCTLVSYTKYEGTIVYEEKSIPEMLELGQNTDSMQYLVTGTVISIADASVGNMTIADAEGNSIYVYKTDWSDFGTQPVVGNTIVLLASAGQYNGVSQLVGSVLQTIKDNSTTLTGIYQIVVDAATLEVVETVNPTSAEETQATITLPTTLGANGTTVTWKQDGVAIENGIAVLTYGAEETTVILTATLINGEASKEYTYEVKVGKKLAAGEAVILTTKYTFSDYAAGKQYEKNEEHVLDENVTVIVDDGHFTTQLRLYDSASNDGTAVVKSKNVINEVAINAGYKAATLNVYGSTDGVTWTLIQELTTKSAYADYTVTIANSAYTYLKLDAVGNQIRIASMTLTVTA